MQAPERGPKAPTHKTKEKGRCRVPSGWYVHIHIYICIHIHTYVYTVHIENAPEVTRRVHASTREGGERT